VELVRLAQLKQIQSEFLKNDADMRPKNKEAVDLPQKDALTAPCLLRIHNHFHSNRRLSL
jgi:hypothetical protein